MTKEATYTMAVETDLTRQQLTGLRNHLHKIQVSIVQY